MAIFVFLRPLLQNIFCALKRSAGSWPSRRRSAANRSEPQRPSPNPNPKSKSKSKPKSKSKSELERERKACPHSALVPSIRARTSDLPPRRPSSPVAKSPSYPSSLIESRGDIQPRGFSRLPRPGPSGIPFSTKFEKNLIRV